MLDHCQHGGILPSSGHISAHAQNHGQKRGAKSHSHLVAKGNKGILEPIIPQPGLPLPIFHTVRDDCIDGCIKPGKEELGQCRYPVKQDGGILCRKQPQPHHGNAGQECKNGCRPSLVVGPAKQQWKTGCPDNGRDYDTHGIYAKERLAALHIGEIIQCIRIPPIQCEPEQQLACQGKDIGTVLGYGRKLFLQGNLLMLRYGHHFLCLCKTEHVAQGKDASVNNGY